MISKNFESRGKAHYKRWYREIILVTISTWMTNLEKKNLFLDFSLLIQKLSFWLDWARNSHVWWCEWNFQFLFLWLFLSSMNSAFFILNQLSSCLVASLSLWHILFLYFYFVHSPSNACVINYYVKAITNIPKMCTECSFLFSYFVLLCFYTTTKSNNNNESQLSRMSSVHVRKNFIIFFSLVFSSCCK